MLLETGAPSVLTTEAEWTDSGDSPRPRLDYRDLIGCDCAEAVIDDDLAFDRHVLACILSASGSGAEPVGLTDAELSRLMAACFSERGVAAGWDPSPALCEDDEVTMVRDLLLANRSSAGDVGRWLAAMIARRSMEPNHLWEDLGLRERSELTRLLARHFAPLAARNTRNMRWKRFFYRMLCEDDGFVMCTTPVCTQCRDFDLCFGDESGESRMAERRRDAALREPEPR
jgi:nitrogen fixation protein NifQ